MTTSTPPSETTVLVSSYDRASKREGHNPESHYRGLTIHAIPELHPYVADLVTRHLPQGATVLDLASGSGAMALRLRDSGFDVVSTDYVTGNFRLHGSIPFFQANLNEPFCHKVPDRVSAIVACEIIEHLENPRHFARQCWESLPAGGYLFASTPNIANSVSKAFFIRDGTFLWFQPDDYRDSGHITPLSSRQLHEIFSEVGYSFVFEGGCGDATKHLAQYPRMRMLARAIRFVGPSPIEAEIYVCVLRKPQ